MVLFISQCLNHHLFHLYIKINSIKLSGDDVAKTVSKRDKLNSKRKQRVFIQDSSILEYSYSFLHVLSANRTLG